MTERPDHNPYPSEAARQRAITARLLIIIAALSGVLVGGLGRLLGW